MEDRRVAPIPPYGSLCDLYAFDERQMHGMCCDSTTRILFEGRLLCRLSHCLANEATTVS